jgi:hypothetical protein
MKKCSSSELMSVFAAFETVLLVHIATRRTGELMLVVALSRLMIVSGR